MKVNIKHEDVMKVNFYDLSVGKVFIFDDSAYMKIATVWNNDEDEMNAISLVDSELAYFGDYEVTILPKSAVLNIEY